MAIRRGERVQARDVRNEWAEQVALTGIEMGYDFKVVWICGIEEWEAAQAEGREPEGVPWPAEDVRNSQSASV